MAVLDGNRTISFRDTAHPLDWVIEKGLTLSYWSVQHWVMVVIDDAHHHGGGCDLSVIEEFSCDPRGGSMVHTSALNR